jgi:hypothetical protein
LIAQLAVANLRGVHEPRKLARDAVSVESLEGK